MKQSEQKVGPGYKHSKASDISSNNAMCPEGSNIFSNSITNWGPSVQIYGPMRDVSHSNHYRKGANDALKEFRITYMPLCLYLTLTSSGDIGSQGY